MVKAGNTVRRPRYAQSKMLYANTLHNLYSAAQHRRLLRALDRVSYDNDDVEYNLDWFIRMSRPVDGDLIAVPVSYPITLERALTRLEKDGVPVTGARAILAELRPERQVDGVELRQLLRKRYLGYG